MENKYNLDLEKLIHTNKIVSPGLQMNTLYKEFEALTDKVSKTNETNIQEDKDFFVDDLFQNKNILLSKYSNETSE